MDNQNQGSVNDQFNQPSNQQFGQQILPNGNAVLVLGIISIVGCFCYGLVGLVCGIIALVLGGKALKLIKQNPTAYTESSIKNMRAGRICAIIGTSLSAIYFVIIIIYIILLGAALTAMPWESIMRGH